MQLATAWHPLPLRVLLPKAPSETDSVLRFAATPFGLGAPTLLPDLSSLLYHSLSLNALSLWKSLAT